MKRIFGSLFLVSALSVVVFANATLAHADGVAITYETTPLFAQQDFFAGSNTTKMITVTNNTGSLIFNVAMKPINVQDVPAITPDLNITITLDGHTYYTSTLANFFTTTAVVLPGLGDGQTAQYQINLASNITADQQALVNGLNFDIQTFAGSNSTSSNSGSFSGPASGSTGGTTGGGNTGGGTTPYPTPAGGGDTSTPTEPGSTGGGGGGGIPTAPGQPGGNNPGQVLGVTTPTPAVNGEQLPRTGIRLSILLAVIFAVILFVRLKFFKYE